MEFARCAFRREDKKHAVVVDAERKNEGLAPRRRQPRKLWYARCRFWREAELFFEERGEDLRSVSDLSPEGRKCCLLKTHEYFRINPAFQMRGRGSGFVILGKGLALDIGLDDGRFAYNGSGRGKGRVFEWYRKAVFQDCLRELGWTERGCKAGAAVHASVTEQQCMLALKLTHQHLARFPAACAVLEFLAGPQC